MTTQSNSEHSIGIEIDKLTNSIVNTISGDSFPTNIHPLSKTNLKYITKSKGWQFNWAQEYKLPDRQTYKLTIRDNPDQTTGQI